MKVVELIEQLKQLPSDATVVVPASDHSYRQVDIASEAKAEFHLNQYTEYYDDFDYEVFGEIVDVVVIS